MNGGWIGLKLGMAGRTLSGGPSGLNLDGLRMSITLKLVSFVGFSSSLLFCCFLLGPLSLLDMFNGCDCPELLWGGGT